MLIYSSSTGNAITNQLCWCGCCLRLRAGMQMSGARRQVFKLTLQLQLRLQLLDGAHLALHLLLLGGHCAAELLDLQAQVHQVC